MNINDRLKEHFNDMAGTSAAPTQDAMKTLLIAEGYSGTLNDMLNAYLTDLGFTGLAAEKFKKYVDEVSDSTWDNLVAYYPLETSVKPLKGEGSLSVARASAATYIHPTTGAITSVGNNVARFESNGLLLEEARTNEAIYSTYFAAAYLSANVTASANAGTAMLGYSTGCSATLTSYTGVDYIGVPVVPASNGTYTCSYWVVGIGSSIGKTIDIGVYDNDATAVRGIETYTLSGVPQRISVEATGVVLGNLNVVLLGNLHALGGAATITTSDVFLFDGAQAELGVGTTSNIFTTGTAATRAADVATIDVDNLPVYTTDCSISAVVRTKPQPTGYHVIFDIAGEQYRYLGIDAPNEKIQVYAGQSASAQDGSAIPHSTDTSIVFTYDADGSWVTYVNGTQDDTDTVGNGGAITGTATSITVGPVHGWIRDFKIYNRVLTATEV